MSTKDDAQKIFTGIESFIDQTDPPVLNREETLMAFA